MNENYPDTHDLKLIKAIASLKNEKEVKKKFRKKVVEPGIMYLPKVVSRKKQIQHKVLEMLR